MTKLTTILLTLIVLIALGLTQTYGQQQSVLFRPDSTQADGNNVRFSGGNQNTVFQNSAGILVGDIATNDTIKYFLKFINYHDSIPEGVEIDSVAFTLFSDPGSASSATVETIKVSRPLANYNPETLTFSILIMVHLLIYLLRRFHL